MPRKRGRKGVKKTRAAATDEAINSPESVSLGEHADKDVNNRERKDSTLTDTDSDTSNTGTGAMLWESSPAQPGGLSGWSSSTPQSASFSGDDSGFYSGAENYQMFESEPQPYLKHNGFTVERNRGLAQAETDFEFDAESSETEMDSLLTETAAVDTDNSKGYSAIAVLLVFAVLVFIFITFVIGPHPLTRVETTHDSTSVPLWRYPLLLLLGIPCSVVMATLIGLSCCWYSCSVTHYDSLKPGHIPPSLFSYSKSRSSNVSYFQLSYILSILNGMLLAAYSIWWPKGESAYAL